MKLAALKTHKWLFWVLFSLLFFSACKPDITKVPGFDRIVEAGIENGLVDISLNGNVRLSRIDRYQLSGKWHFIPAKHFSQSDIDDLAIEDRHYITVPGNWNKSNLNENPTGKGMGTYHLQFELSDRDLEKELALYFPNIEMPIKVLLNGVPLVSFGDSSISNAKKRLIIKNDIISLKPLQNKNSLIIQMSNMRYRYEGGLTVAPEIVEVNWLKSHYEFETMLNIFFATAFLIFGFSYLILFLIRKKELHHLFFALFSFFFCMYVVFSFHGGILSLFNRIDSLQIQKVMQITQIFSFSFILIFIQTLYKRFFSEWFQYGIASLSFIFSVILIVVPIHLIDQFFYILYIFFTLFVLVTLIVMLFQFKSRQKGLRISFMALLPILAVSVYQILLIFGIGYPLDYLMEFAVILFAFVHMILIQSGMNDLYIGRDRLKRENLDLQRKSLIDTLTQLPNRRRFEEILQYYWNYCMNEDKYLAIGFIDIDFCAQFNEHYGNSMGDACIKRVAQSINNTLRRPEDFVGRYEGQRFVFILPDTNVANGKAASERIRADIERQAIEHKGVGEKARVTVSIGAISFKPSDSHSRSTVLKGALQALHKSKNEGRNECRVFLVKAKNN